MNKLFIIASMLALTATAADAPRQSLQDRVAALETQVFGKPSVAARPVAAAAKTPEEVAKLAADRAAAREARLKANPELAARLKDGEERRAAMLAARTKPVDTGKPAEAVKPGNGKPK